MMVACRSVPLRPNFTSSAAIHDALRIAVAELDPNSCEINIYVLC